MAASPKETFDIACDCARGLARVAMRGSSGSEILIVLPAQDFIGPSEEETRRKVLEQAEARMRAALLSLIASNWPTEN